MSDLYLVHHGVKGMHWGVRKYQDRDGNLTEAGKKRYSGSDGEFRKKVDNYRGKRGVVKTFGTYAIGNFGANKAYAASRVNGGQQLTSLGKTLLATTVATIGVNAASKVIYGTTGLQVKNGARLAASFLAANAANNYVYNREAAKYKANHK